MAGISELTIVFYTANVIPDIFANTVRTKLLESSDGARIITVSLKPMGFDDSIVVHLPRHHLSIYKQALIGAKEAKTKYIALCEDDVLYSPEHFKHRPQPGRFAYNLGHWNIYTWMKKPVFSWKGRRNLGQLICERDLFIEAMEERFSKHDDDVDISIWAEPGKYESKLGVTQRQCEEFWTNPPNVAFSHETALSFTNLGTRKRLGELRATEIPYWGTATEVRSMYL